MVHAAHARREDPAARGAEGINSKIALPDAKSHSVWPIEVDAGVDAKNVKIASKFRFLGPKSQFFFAKSLIFIRSKWRDLDETLGQLSTMHEAPYQEILAALYRELEMRDG